MVSPRALGGSGALEDLVDVGGRLSVKARDVPPTAHERSPVHHCRHAVAESSEVGSPFPVWRAQEFPTRVGRFYRFRRPTHG